MYMIYGVSDCPWCLRAQALCMDKGVDYTWVMMDWSKDYREWTKGTFKWSTYPIITKLDFESGEGMSLTTWVDEKLVGGFDELKVVLLSAEE
tara:strand:- start:1004 stop:1279 length:276 start_codon:yes stop_codon:yes gene_type:complete